MTLLRNALSIGFVYGVMKQRSFLTLGIVLLLSIVGCSGSRTQGLNTSTERREAEVGLPDASQPRHLQTTSAVSGLECRSLVGTGFDSSLHEPDSAPPCQLERSRHDSIIQSKLSQVQDTKLRKTYAYILGYRFSCKTSTASEGWAVRVDEISFLDPDTNDADIGILGRMVVAWVSEGREVTTRDVGLPPTNGLRYGDFTDDTAWLELVHDWNRDGRPEALVVSSNYAHEAEFTKEATILTTDGHHITPYLPAKGLQIGGAIDYDGDGRLDVISHAPFFVQVTGALGPVTAHGPALLFHALPDGTFSRDDDVARHFARCSCPDRLEGENGDLTSALIRVFEEYHATWFVTLSCARLWGMSVEASLDGIRSACRGTEHNIHHPCQQLDELTQAATIEPPFQLP